MSNILNQSFGSAPYVPQVGDIIRVSRFLYNHVGIYVGIRPLDHRDVIHNDKHGGVVLCTLAEFAGGMPIYLEKLAPRDRSARGAVVGRAFSLIGRQFDLLEFNCEHAANWSQTGKMESPQLKGFAVLGFLGLLGLAAVVSRKS